MSDFHIPDYYIESKIFQHTGDAVMNSSGVINGGCPFCMEGDSWGKKKRLFYYPDKQLTTCFNCGIAYNPINFIMNVEDKSFATVIKEVREQTGETDFSKKTYINVDIVRDDTPVKLPPDAINLMEPIQVSFYKNIWSVEKAINTLKSRRLLTAKYRTDLYLSTSDFTHKDRIIIPFYNECGKLLFFQSRAQTKKHELMGKYMSSVNGNKIFFGLDKINHNYEYIFVLEGPLDCFFVKNSIGGGGLKLNKNQKETLNRLSLFSKVVYCIDNDFDNKDVVKQYIKYIKEGELVFMWGGDFSEYKDFNEYAVAKGIDNIPTEDILRHIYSGKDALRMLISKKKC